MAVLSEADRVAIWIDYMRQRFAAKGMTKADLRATVDAADSWADTNAASYNTALPLAARTNLTAKEKAALLMLVILRRYQVA
jgi:hypothetical protein